MKRRDALKLGLGAAGATTVASQAGAVEIEQWPDSAEDGLTQSGLVFPDTFQPSIVAQSSPAVEPFTAPLNIMPVAEPVDPNTFDPPIEPARHQRFDDFPPQKHYEEVISEFRWKYHWQPPYGDGTPGVVGRDGDPDVGSWHWGFNGITPGETYHANYGEPVFLRRNNLLPTVGAGNVTFALPSPTVHLHNGHTASESDGIPQDFFNPGEFWDHHYANFPAGSPNGWGASNTEIMNTLWYHDHRLDFTATNVYAGLSGFYLLFDERDSNNEEDPNFKAFRLPSGKYDVPLILHDVMFQPNGQVIWDFFSPDGAPHPEPRPDPVEVGNSQGTPDTFDSNRLQYTTQGMTGDKITVNRIIQPYLDVERRKYRFRLLNGGPSRLYRLVLRVIPADGGEPYYDDWIILSNDGNLLEAPLLEPKVDLWIANRFDVVIDFSKFGDGDKVQVLNDLEIRGDGAGPTGYTLEGENLMPVIEFRCEGPRVRDPSRVPRTMRRLPKVRMSEVRRRRLFVFDYDNGLWTVNGRLMDPNRVDAKIEQGTAEIWTFRNEGNAWAHPVHTHFEEFQILEVNGRPPSAVERARKDVVSLGPGDEVTFFSRWRDFFGKHVMHCHNVVHEDHAMMIRWDIVPEGEGD
ncbi:multicopper oxidase domain-containing protein [uncultured Roseovarius sp.]|uniref:multicopper oxidase domain-containing protein n=1 Tax=uncultured Roseovarius sp. TaxID=293344 RepID=UPI00262DD28B|nr:multicopper oxidase domain-containing protein [uncultured Roseovarius sp.]